MKKLGYSPQNTIPQDITAKKVVFYDGDHYNPKVKSDKHLFSTKALPIRAWNSLPLKVVKDPNFKDLRGKKFGRFTVEGMLLCNEYNKWVIKCKCGNFEARTTTSLNKMEDRVDKDRCQECVDLERLRHREYWKIHGLYPWQKNTSNR